MTQRLGRRIAFEALHLLAIILLLILTLYLFFHALPFGHDRSFPTFLAFCHSLWRDAEGREVLPQLWRALGISGILIAGSLAISIPLSLAAGWWSCVEPRATGLTLLFTIISSVPAFAWAYAFQRFSNTLFFPILTLAISDLMLSLATSHVMKELTLELRRNYVRTAKVKGVSPFLHYWRRLAVEALSVTKSRIAYLIGGAVVVERIFSLRGLGNMAILAVKRTPPDLTILLWICLLSLVAVYLLNLCESVLRDLLIPSPLSDESLPSIRERLSAFRKHLRTLIATRSTFSVPRITLPATRLRLALVVRLRELWAYSAMNRIKIVLGITLWSITLISFITLLAAGPLSHTRILGVNCTGQDVLGSVLLAGRRLLLPLFLGALLPILLGLLLGAYVGYFRFTLLSRAIECAMDLLDSMPKLVLAMIFAAIVRADSFYLYKVIPFMGFTFTPIIYDLVRKKVEYLQRMNFVEAERSLGASVTRILFLHIIFNNCRSLITVHGVHLLGQIVLLDAAFDYLGLAQPEHYTWGALFYNSIYDALMGGEANPWAYIAPLAAVLFTVLALITLSQGLEAVLEPQIQEAT